jgi:RimJ/RimL family protein N-acetyltransferase
MTDLITERLRLHPLTEAEARRILDATPDEQDDWAEDFPREDDRDGVKGFLRGLEAGLEPGPFGNYRIDHDGHAVGTIGFFGPPNVDGEVMFGYGLVPGARGHGFATEAVARLVELCRADEDVLTMLADTDTDNTPSQRVLDKTGFALVKEENGLYYYTLDVTGS